MVLTLQKKIMKNKIIAISMHTDKKDIKKMQQAGAKGYLLKDTIAKTLTDAIAKTLRGDGFFILR
jgi:DNA-binding NarL/FixJ family response regulator